MVPLYNSKMPVQISCKQCGLQILVKPSRASRTKYCSKICHNNSMRGIRSPVTKVCRECSSGFVIKPCIAKIRKFCSSKCANVFRGRHYDKNGSDHSRYTNGSGIYRNKALGELGGKCNRCNRQDHLEVHHIDRDRKNNDIKNLEVLCKKCHTREHRPKKDNALCKICRAPTKRPGNIYCSRYCYYESIQAKAK